MTRFPGGPIYVEKPLRLIFFRRAFAIPLVILFAVVIMIFSFMLLSSNVQSKKQKISNLLSTKAYFMAQAGLQHFKLKYKVKPQLMFDCGRLYMGFSPVYNDPNQFDDIASAGRSYPHYLARFFEDVTSGYDKDTDTATPAGLPSLVEVDKLTGNVERSNVGKKGGMKTMPLSMCGFALVDAKANEDLTDWGYRPVLIRNGSLRRATEGGKNFMEQSITIEMLGRAKSNVEKKEEKKEINVRETIIVRKYTN